MKIMLFLTSIRIYFLNWKLRTHCLNDGSVPMILFVCGSRNRLYFYLLFHHICTVVNSGSLNWTVVHIFRVILWRFCGIIEHRV